VEELRTIRADPARVEMIREVLGTLLSPNEVNAVFARWDRLLADPCYPLLDPYRNVPWPPF